MYKFTAEQKTRFAENLKSQMEAKGWHQSELARRADLPRDSVSVYLRAKSGPTPESLSKLAAALSVSTAELLGADVPPLPGTPPREGVRIAIDERSNGTALIEFSGVVTTRVLNKLLIVLASRDGEQDSSD